MLLPHCVSADMPPTDQFRLSDFLLVSTAIYFIAEEGICRPQLYGDGNFKVTHLRKAGTATLHDTPLQHRFPDDAKVAEFCQSRVVSRAKGSSETKECNDFDADKQLGRTSEKYDFTGQLPTYSTRLNLCHFVPP